MSGQKLAIILGLASCLASGYAEVAGVVGPHLAGARSLAGRVGPREGLTVDQLAGRLGVEQLPGAEVVVGRGRGVFEGYAARVREAGGF